ncbi:hypothetical protein LOC71_15820 [Rhodopirellula sp. JC740]|uniref:Uncharacterized protein n=1 Tax=Rhodopirellula halodulae TaxID=2894198 RepID=A0ABS8NJN1_9BACT|nr:hypothetical protein [Rhodopirellula sp. JC740]MCC9643754.1 hypothetical protein [Rhodopirellula sp. JC740]
MTQSKLPKKSICKWDKSTLADALPLLADQIRHAEYVCRKCGRSAAEKKLLCKAVRMDSLSETKA